MTLLDLLKLVRKHMQIVILIPILCAIIAGIVSWVFLPDLYTARVSMYILTKSSEAPETITNTDLTASQMITNDVSKLIKSDRVLNDAASSLQMSDLGSYTVSVGSETTTRVITLEVEGQSANAVAVIANAIAKATDEVAQEVMDLRSVNVVDMASEPLSPSGPPRVMYTGVALLAGLFLAIAIIVLLDILDTRVRNPEEIEELISIPVLGRIPVENK